MRITIAIFSLSPVSDPQSFGIAWIDGSGRIVNMQEKPETSDSNLAITGLYIYTPRVYSMIDEILETTGYSSRGELEITDINRLFMQKTSQKAVILIHTGLIAEPLMHCLRPLCS